MSDHGSAQRFEAALRDAYRRAANEAGYTATRFKQMLDERGGVATAKALLNEHPNRVSEGFTQLALKQRLDLTVESIVLDDEWKRLFSTDELATAKRRLRK